MVNITNFLAKHIIPLFSVLTPHSKEVTTLNIKNGAIKGSRAETVDQHKPYYSFRAIRYAEPPIGDLRFRAPVPAKNWSGVLDATSDGNICVQANLQGSEDCLFINVYTPKLPVHNTSATITKLPVMVWIYGGIFMRGSSTYQRYSPDYFLDADVIFVSFNYRTGVFGFLSTSDEAASGNWGLKDQLLALRWVQDNIEYFGGNKSDVTIFGESAGAASISFLMQFPSSENLFHKAIMESGSSLNEWALSRQARDCAFSLGQLLNVNTKNSKVLVRRLRRVNTSKLMISSLQVDLVKTFTTNPLNGLIYAPCKETDQHGDFLVGENYEYLRKGRFTRVPVIIGFNSQESGDFDKALQAIEPYLLSYALDPRRLVPIDLNLNNDTIRSYIAIQIKERYCPRIHYRHLVDNNLLQFFTDDQFVRPINEAARLMSKYVPVYHYKFSYIDNITAEKSDEVGVGAAHASELNYMFANNNNLVKTTSDRLTRLRMIRLWTNFVKTGNPTPEEDDLFDRVIWTTYDQGEFMDIGHSLKMSSDLRKYSVDWWKNIYDKYAIHPLDTY